MKIAHLAAAAVILVGSATMADQADAQVAFNAYSVNGMPNNGIGHQGMRMQGAALHQGQRRSAQSQRGFDFNSMIVDDVTLPSEDRAKTLPLAQ